MTYHIDLHNAGYYGRRSKNTKAAAMELAQSHVLQGGSRSATISRSHQRGYFMRYWTDTDGKLQYINY